MRKSWRNGPPKNTACALGEQDHDLLDECTIPDAMQHARKLCGLLPYSLPEVKPAVSARYIFILVRIITRMRAAKNYQRLLELRQENKDLSSELARCRREMQRWGIAYPGSGEKQRALPRPRADRAACLRQVLPRALARCL
jgi:hypothetical protein